MPERLLIADSGPLIALARLNLLMLPGRYFDQVMVSTTVWREVCRGRRSVETDRLQEALARSLFDLTDQTGSIPPKLQEASLDAGERHTLALGLELGAAVLVDERKGRRIAAELGLPVLGTLGLLIRARESGLLPALKPLIESLQGSGYFLSPSLVERVLADLGEA